MCPIAVYYTYKIALACMLITDLAEEIMYFTFAKAFLQKYHLNDSHDNAKTIMCYLQINKKINTKSIIIILILNTLHKRRRENDFNDFLLIVDLNYIQHLLSVVFSTILIH